MDLTLTDVYCDSKWAKLKVNVYFVDSQSDSLDSFQVLAGNPGYLLGQNLVFGVTNSANSTSVTTIQSRLLISGISKEGLCSDSYLSLD